MAGAGDPISTMRRIAEARSAEFRPAFESFLTEAIDEIPSLRPEAGQLEVLRRLVDHIGDGLLAELESADDTTAPQAPPVTPSLARETVHWGLPCETMLETIHIGYQATSRWWLGCLREDVPDPAARLAVAEASIGLFHRFTRAMMRRFVDEYDAERSVWRRSAAARRREVVETILAGDVDVDPLAVAPTLGYRLEGRHVGLCLWPARPADPTADVLRLDRVAHLLARASGVDAPLLVEHDGPVLWAWFATTGELDLRAAGGEAADGVRVAVGEPGTGVDGFRATHHEAARARELVLRTGLADGLVRYLDVEMAALVIDDPIALRRFAARQLGRLAEPVGPAARVRPTLREWLRHQAAGEAAAHIHIHRNTLARHLEQAAELRGRPLTEDRVGLALALELHAAGLVPPHAPH